MDGTTYAYDGLNRLTQLAAATLGYDANGNATTDEAGRTLVYDAWNRLVEVKTGNATLARYAYDALSRRVNDGTSDVYFDTAWQCDSPGFTPAVREVVRRRPRLLRVLADSGFDSHANHVLARDVQPAVADQGWH